MFTMPDLAELAAPSSPSFRTQESVRAAIREACRANADVASFLPLGASEEGRPLDAVLLGKGGHTVSLMAGAHADEPVGPETLRTFILEGLRRRELLEPLLAAFRFVIVPHINPDGEARNQPWITRWPSLAAFLEHVDRELPGRDLEFGFPAMRQENRLVADLLRRFAPFALHMSFHGMAFSEGAMLLIERHWAGRTQALRDDFVRAAQQVGLPLHDHNRKGEKGFFYIEPGFTTTPEGAAMQAHFRALGDDAMAARFHRSSMEFVRSLGGDPLCLVTEMPLFMIQQREPRQAGHPHAYLDFQQRLPQWKQYIARGKAIEPLIESFGIQPLPALKTRRLHLQTLGLGLEALSGALPEKAECNDPRYIR